MPDPAAKPCTVNDALMPPAERVTLLSLKPNKSGERDESLSDKSAPDSPGSRLMVTARASPTVFVSVGVGENTIVGSLTVTGRFVA